MIPHPFKAAVVVLALVVSLASSAATREEEAKFVDAAKKAFDEKKPVEFSKITCWDGIAEKDKKGQEETYRMLMDEKDVTFSVTLVELDPKRPAKERKEKGVPLRPNLKVVKQLDVKMTDARDKKTLGIIGFPVGEKDGKLWVTSEVPAK